MDNYVLAMGLTRAIFSVVNGAAALLMWKMADAGSAMRINAIIGSIIGPFTFILVTGLGLAALSKTLVPSKIALILLGTALILVGTRQ